MYYFYIYIYNLYYKLCQVAAILPPYGYSLHPHIGYIHSLLSIDDIYIYIYIISYYIGGIFAFVCFSCIFAYMYVYMCMYTSLVYYSY